MTASPCASASTGSSREMTRPCPADGAPRCYSTARGFSGTRSIRSRCTGAGRHGPLRHVVQAVHEHPRRTARLSAAVGGHARPRRQAAVRLPPFHPLDGNYVIRAPRPRPHARRRRVGCAGDEPAFVATMQGKHRPATITEVLRLQFVAPAAPLLGRLAMRVQGVLLWLAWGAARAVAPNGGGEACAPPLPRCGSKSPTCKTRVWPRDHCGSAARLRLNDPIAAGGKRAGRIAAPSRRPGRRRVRQFLRLHPRAGLGIGDSSGA